MRLGPQSHRPVHRKTVIPSVIVTPVFVQLRVRTGALKRLLTSGYKNPSSVHAALSVSEPSKSAQTITCESVSWKETALRVEEGVVPVKVHVHDKCVFFSVILCGEKD